MSQQLAIIVVVDVSAALKSRILKDNIYLFDNMKLQGSEGEGTSNLVTAINGNYWSDGSQASEQVLNWLPYSLGSIPPTVPRNYQAQQEHHSDQAALDALSDIAKRTETAGADIKAELNTIQRKVGTKTTAGGGRRAHSMRAEHKVMDVTGAIVSLESEDTPTAHNNRAPLITDIVGEAVDEKIIYPALYGSPDMVSEGWYWSASVDTSRPGTYTYTMEIELHELTLKDGDWVWQPVRMLCDSHIRIATESRVNGFTKSGLGMLPIVPTIFPAETPAKQ